jgi:hypothetical protein
MFAGCCCGSRDLTWLRLPAARSARALHKHSPPKREQGMPGARCTRGLVCKIVRRNAHEHTGSAETLRHPPRNGFTAYAVLFPATNSSCHRHRRIEGFVAPGWARKNLRRFDTSNGCQNHTVLPYATAPFVLHAGVRSRKTALRTFAHSTLPRPPHPLPNVADDHDTPLLRAGTAGVVVLICPSG